MVSQSRHLSRNKLMTRDLPFKHVIFASLLSDRRERSTIRLLEETAWQEHSGSFFRFRIPIERDTRSQFIEHLRDVFLSASMISVIEELFECRLGKEVQLEVHKYLAGDGIGPHTDSSRPEIRCVLNLNRSWRKEDGGIWILASDASLRTSAAFLPALSNTGFIFSTCDRSFHALSKYNGKEIYGLAICIPRI